MQFTGRDMDCLGYITIYIFIFLLFFTLLSKWILFYSHWSPHYGAVVRMELLSDFWQIICPVAQKFWTQIGSCHDKYDWTLLLMARSSPRLLDWNESYGKGSHPAHLLQSAVFTLVVILGVLSIDTVLLSLNLWIVSSLLFLGMVWFPRWLNFLLQTQFKVLGWEFGMKRWISKEFLVTLLFKQTPGQPPASFSWAPILLNLPIYFLQRH